MINGAGVHGTAEKPVVGISVESAGTHGAPVDLRDGHRTADRARLLTPSPATPGAVASVVDTVVELLCAPGPVGITVPAIVRDGVVTAVTALDPQWIGVDAVDLFARATGAAVAVVNEADAAGIAEMRYGAGRDRSGVVVVITLGSGIGSALFLNGTLVPNTELGTLALPHEDTRDQAAEPITGGPFPPDFARPLQRCLGLVERLLWPDLIILAGPAGLGTDALLPHLDLRTEVVPAGLGHGAGVVGAALLAATQRAPVAAGERWEAT